MDDRRPACSNRAMIRSRLASHLCLLRVSLWLAIPAIALQAKTSVWKITSPSGQVLYLGGSQHRLKGTDYPLPSAYNQAFDLSQRIAFEESPEDPTGAVKRLEKSGLYPKGDQLRNHVDPRTYDYLTKFFGRMGVSPEKLASCRPWFLVYMLSSGGGANPGVEAYFAGRAKTHGRPIEGLESNSEHLQIFSGLSDRQSEALLLVTFIQAKGGSGADVTKMTAAWRAGNPDYIERMLRAEYRDYPAMADRLLTTRNLAWIPKIESWIRSGHTYFVLAGAAHMGGPNGLLALLRARGYQIEQW